MRKVVAFIPLYAVYWFGVLASELLNMVPDGAPDWALWNWMYKIYNRCMCWSLSLNDWAGFNLWTHVAADD